MNTGTGNGSLTLRLANATGILPGISTALPFVGETYTIDKTAPTVNSVAVPANATYRAGQALSFTVNFSEAVTVTGTPQLGLTLDTGGSVQANYVSGSGTSALVFSYTVVAGNADANGITVGTLGLNGGTIRDAATNPATLTLNGLPATAGILVDGIAPTVLSSSRQAPTAATTNASSLTFRVTFSESVTGVDATDFTLTTTAGTVGNTGRTVAAVSGSVYDVTVSGVSGNGTVRLDLNGSGTGISDVAGNAISGGYTGGQTFTIDQTAPTVTALTTTAGASGTTTTTTPFNFTVTFSEAVTGFSSSGITVGNGTVTSGPTAGSGNSYTFTVTPATAGTATTVTVAANAAQDAAGNGSTVSSTYTLTYILPTATVTSISKLAPTAAQSAGGTATAQVSFTVTFSAPVSGVSASNFSLSPAFSGATIASVSPATGASATYTVVVNTGTSDGTLQLNVANATGITPSVTNTPYNGTSAVYTITKNFASAPTLRIQAGGSASNNGDVTAFVDVVQVLLSGTGTVVPNGLQNGSFETNNVPANGFRKASDAVAVAAAPWSFNGTSGVARYGSAFDSQVPGHPQPLPPNGDAVALIQSVGNNNASISQNLAVPTGSYQVSFQTAQRYYTAVDQRLNVFVNDVFVGNIQPNNTPSYEFFTSATFNVFAPALTATVSTTSVSPTSTSPIPFSVSFTQGVGTTFTASDVTVTGGTLNAAGFSGSGAGPYTFTVTPTGTGPVTVSLAAGVATDANNTPNTASNVVSVQYQPPVTAAPVLTAPANNATTTPLPTFTGTAPAGSTVTLYLAAGSGAAQAFGTATATGGSFSFAAPAALAPGSYAASATAQLSGQAVSSRSNVNAFTVTDPATYTSSTADQPNGERVLAGSTNQVILRVAVVVGGGNTPALSVQSLAFTTTGSTSAVDIAAARVYYTGSNSTFAPTTAFGSAVATPSGAFTVAGTQQLTTGINYFWLVYDVAAAATPGNVLDATITSLRVGGVDYTPANANPTGNRSIILIGRVAGTALRFIGGNTAGYANFSASATQGPLLGAEYTQMAWIKPAIGTGSVTYYVLGNGTGNAAAPYLYVTGNGRLGAGFGTGGATVNRQTGPNTLVANEWQHVAATYNGSVLTLYLNGVAVETLNSSELPASTRVNYVGGAGTTGSGFFPGDLDEVSQWSRALGVAEIRLLRHLTLSGTETGLASYLQFNESGTTTADGVRGAVGTLTGATRVTSTAPVGGGTSSRQVVTGASNYAFPGTNASINFTAVTGTPDDVVVTRLEGRPLGTQVTDPSLRNAHTRAYWIVNKYSPSSFAAAITYTLDPGLLSAADAATPSLLKLYKRESNSDGAFDAPISATAANATASTVTFPVNSFSQMFIGTYGSSPLPVELVRFTAERRKADALLEWATASEKNNDYFEAESSVDGYTFRTVGRVAGQGSSSQPHEYQLTDAHLARYQAAVVYYRLRQVDQDGTATLSSVRTVQVPKNASALTATVFPNPATDQLTVRLSSAYTGKAQGWLYDVQGRLVREMSCELAASNPDINLSVKQLPDGVYTLRLVLDGQVLHQQIVVQR